MLCDGYSIRNQKIKKQLAGTGTHFVGTLTFSLMFITIKGNSKDDLNVWYVVVQVHLRSLNT